ncbi:MarR family winged helix-turn-helix transcriptional regulator [Helicobacter equorum]|uniref:MarR family winged helix-turn-helix transcriptional regulator n=1 Tax=Helicobacter equorum TaxID=361872 RepID=UPI000CF0DBB1|nr:MarR family transcriptional regulator [Helicobacter equorum]
MFEESIFFLCQKLVYTAKTHFREMVLTQFGFTDGREVGILFIAMDTQLSQTEIANIMEIDKNTTRFFIDDLEQRGLLQRQKNPTNRKENLIIITPEGKKQAKKIFSATLQHERELLHTLSDKEFTTLHKLLAKFFYSIDSTTHTLAHK